MGAARSTFLGYRRPDGVVGVRNHVALLSVMDNTNPVVRQAAMRAEGAIALCPTFGRALLPDDERRHVETLVGLGRNPNVQSVVLIGLEPKMTGRVAEAIAQGGKPVEAFVVQRDGGTRGTLERASRAAQLLLGDASRQQREACAVGELTIGLECGGSDATSGLVGNTVVGLVSDDVVAGGGRAILSEPVEMVGAEHLLAARARSPEVARALLEAVAATERHAAQSGVDIAGSNPAPDNILGGLTTIEEKALGAIRKAGSSTLEEVVPYGLRPTRRGLIVMEGPAPAVENMTGLAASGANLILFYTGQGNTIGNPVAPTIKLCANPKTLELMPEDIDVSLAAVLEGRETLREAAQRVLSFLLDTASGSRTASERLGQTEIAVSRANVGL